MMRWLRRSALALCGVTLVLRSQHAFGEDEGLAAANQKECVSSEEHAAVLEHFQRQLNTAQDKCKEDVTSAVTALQEDLRSSQRALVGCEETRKSHDLRVSSCEARVSELESAAQSLRKCQSDLDEKEKQWSKTKSGFQTQITTLEKDRKAAVTECAAQKSSLKKYLDKCTRELESTELERQEAERLLEAARKRVAENIPHVFSKRQFYDTVEKLARLGHALLTDFFAYVRNTLGTWFSVRYTDIATRISERWGVISVSARALWKEKHLDLYWAYVHTAVAAGARTAQDLWHRYGDPAWQNGMDYVSTSIVPVVVDLRTQLESSFNLIHVQLNEHIIEPFKQRYPQVADLIPSGIVDQCFALGFVGILYYVALRWCLSAVSCLFCILKHLLYAVFYCGKCSRRSRRSHNKRKAASKKIAKRDAPQVPPSTASSAVFSLDTKVHKTESSLSGQETSGQSKHRHHRSSRNRVSPTQ